MRFLAKVVFNKELPSWKRRILEREYMDRRNIFVEKVNPMYEKWNKEFDDLYPERITDRINDELYLNFIRSKQKDFIDIANRKSIGFNFVKLDSDEYCDVIGLYKNVIIRISIFEA